MVSLNSQTNAGTVQNGRILQYVSESTWAYAMVRQKTHQSASGLLLLFIILLVPMLSFGQFNNGYNFRMPIGISESMIPDGATLTDFPLYIDVTSSNLSAAAAKVTSSSGYDILIADSLGNTLDYEFIAYNGTTGRFQAWVRLPSLSDVDTTVLYLYYGNSLVTTDPSVSGTWSSDFIIVDHMESTGSANAVSGGVSPSSDNTSSATGLINNARSFNGSTQIVQYPHGTATDRSGNFTISMWINSTNSGSSPDLMSKWSSNSGYIFTLAGNDIQAKSDKSSITSSANAIADNNWHHVAVVWNASTTNRYLYIDGVEVKSDGKPGPSSTTTPLTYSSIANPFAGLMDEVRLVGVPRSSNWMTTEFNNQSAPDTFITMGEEECSSITYYTYLSGDFHSATNWTTDPSGASLTNPAIPTSCDNIVILNGKTITVSSNNLEIDGVVINGSGTLDFGTSTGHSIGPVSGTGTLILRSETLPIGDYTAFGSSSGGTLQITDLGTGTFPSAVNQWNNITLQSANATADVITLGSDLTLKGNLTLSATSGTVEFVFGNDATVRNLTIEGNVTLGPSTTLSVNNANAVHQFELMGSLTSNGNIDFSNAAQYATSTTGAVELTMTGESDEVITGSGSQLDLYRLILHKGTNDIHSVSVNHSAFALYGPTNLANGSTSSPYSAENPEINKAIWIRAGTLILSTGVSLPQLTSGGDHFTIPQAGKLWIAGADVQSVLSSGSTTNTGVIVHGTFQISEGSFNSNQSAGLIYGGNGTVNISGGIVNVSQLRPLATLTTATNAFSYLQSGGQMICRGDAEEAGSVDADFAIFDLGFSSSAYTHSSGQIVIRDISASNDTGGVYIGVNAPNASISGGNYLFDLPGGSSAYLNSTVDIPCFHVSRRSGTGQASVIAGSPLTINDTLDVQLNGLFDANGFNIQLEANLEVNGTLSPGLGRWTATGSGSRTWNISSTTGSFQDLKTDLASNDSLTLTGISSLSIADSLDIRSGTLFLDGTNLEVQSTFSNSGITRGSAAIVFSGGTSFIWGGSGSGKTHAIQLSGTASSSASVTLASHQNLTDQLTFTSGNPNTSRLLNLSSYNLRIDSTVSISGIGSNGTGANGIVAGGLASDGGLTLEMNTTSISFPFVASNTYAPAVLTLSQAPSAYGTVTVVKVDSEHPNVTESGFSLSTYWAVSSTVSLGSATADWTFEYLDSDIQGTESEYTEAYFSGLFWTYGGTGNVNTLGNSLDFSGFNYNSQISGQYTAGDTTNAQPFGAVEIYYSRQSGAWSNTANWSLKGHNLDSVPSVKPQPNSIVIIGDNDSIWTSANNEAAGALTIENGAVLDIQDNTGHVLGTVSGTGVLRMAQGSLPNGEFSNFLGSSGGTIVIYTNGSNVSYTGIDISCRRMRWVLQSNNRMGLGGSVTVAEDLIVRSLANFGQEIRLEGMNATIGGDFDVYEGQLTYRNGSGPSNFNVAGNYQIRSNATVILDQNSDVVHSTTIGDSLMIDGALDLYKTATQYTEITFDGTGISALTGTATASLYRITIDKGTDTTSQLWLSHSGTLTFQNTAWLILNNGLFVYNRSDTRTVSSSASTFSIPATAGIKMAATGGTLNLLTSASNSADVLLSGTLSCSAGTLNVGLPANSSGNDIIYASVGTPVIHINGGNLFVNGQIRRNTSSTQGSLFMTLQSGGSVTIGGKSATGTRGKLEIANSGSLTMLGGSTLTFNRGGASSISDLYLASGNSDLSGGTLSFTTTSDITSAEQTFKINVDAPLNHLIVTGVSGAPAILQLVSNGITVAGDLTVSNAFSTFHSNTLNVRLEGDLYLYGNGTWTGSTTTFGSSSNFTGTATGTNQLNHVTLASGQSLTFLSGSSMSIGGTLTIPTSSSITLGTGSIFALNTVNLEGVISSDAASSTYGLKMSGTTAQTIYGSGTVDNLIINNTHDVNLSDQFQIDRQLHFTAGRLFISNHALTLNTDVILSGTFSNTKMISTNGLLTDGGVHYRVSSGAKTITIPVGSNGKYAPAKYIFSNLTDTGTVRVVPVDAPHPGTTDTADTQLDYYWYITSSGLGTYTVSHQYQYNGSDINGTENNYVSGYYNVANWEPIDGIVNSVDPTNDTLTIFEVNFLDGEYTAGEPGEFGEAPTFYSRSGSGFYNWDDPNAWSNDSHLGVAASIAPSGTGKIKIAEGDSIYTNGNLRICQSVQNNGTLNLGTTFGHNFGRFNGTGKVIMDVTASNVYIAPAGIYSGFISDTGGTWVYTGSIDAEILNGFSTYDNLTFNGSSTKDLGSQNLTIYGDFTIRGGAVSNSNNIQLEVRKNWTNTVGSSAFDGGTGTVTFTGSRSDISGNTHFNNLTVNFNSGNDSLTLISGNTVVEGTYTETNGVLSLSGGNVEFRGDVFNGTWYSSPNSSVTISGSGTISNGLPFADTSPSLDSLSISRNTALSLSSDLTIHGVLTLGINNFAIGAHRLALQNPIEGTSTSLVGGGTSSLSVFGTGSGIVTPSSLNELQLLEVDNSNGLLLGGNLLVNDSIHAYSGTLNSNGNTLTLSDGGWIEVSEGTVLESITYAGSGNILWNNASDVSTGGEIPFRRNAVQSAIVNGSGVLTLSSDLCINNTLTVNTTLHLGTDSLVLFGNHTGAGEYRSSGGGKLVLRGTGSSTLPNFATAEHTLDAFVVDRTGTHTLSTPLNVANDLQLVNGHVELDTFDMMLGGTIAISSASSSSFLATSGSGSIVQNTPTTGTYNIPTGDLTGDAEYAPISIDITASTTASNPSLRIQSTDAAGVSCGGSTDYITRHWDIAASDLSDVTGTVTMVYVDADIVGTEANVVGKRYNGTYCVNGDSSIIGSNSVSVFIDGFGEFTGREIDIASEPTTSSTSMVFSNVEVANFNLEWSRGDGQQRLVIAREGSAVNFAPEDYHWYEFNTEFGTSPDLGSGQFAVYKGSDSSFSITGLTSNKTYYFEVFEFNKEDTISENYFTSSSLIDNQNTAVQFDLIVFMEGPLDTLTGEMSTTLLSRGLIPLKQPFGSSYAGTESVASVPSNISDWIHIQIYDAPTEAQMTSENIIHEGAYFLRKDGQVVSLDGVTLPTVLPQRSGTLRARIQSRNHLTFASADTFANVENVHVLDTRINGGMSNVATHLYNGWQVVPAGQVETSTPFAIDASDAIQIWNQRNTTNVYKVEDLNWDGDIDAEDRALIFWNIGRVALLP
ncbi:MAG: DUF2341 domain-containing protein [Bacteroidetes bacterium]|nr:MAG: DUF2341 domain-containing protein [Bacteroidota bacterium]